MPGWRRTYWTVWTANLITAIGLMSFLPLFPAHLEHLGLSDRAEIAAWAGVLYGAAPLSAALTSPFWGALGDRFGRKLMVLRAMGAITLFVGLMALARTPLQLLVLRLAQGAFAGFLPPSMTLISVAAPPDRQGQVSAGLQTAVAAGSIVGPAIGGQVSAAFDVRAVFLLVAALTTLSALLVLLLAREAPGLRRPAESGARRASALGGAIEDFRVVLASRELRAALWIVFWIQFGLGATNPILELHVRDLVGGAEALRSTSLLFSAMAAANLPAILLWGRYGDRIGHRAAMLRCALASAAAFALHALAPGYGLLFAARVLLGASMAGLAPSAFGLAATEISADRRGSAFGTVFSARALAVAISAALGGWLSRYIGVPGLFLAGAVLVLASAVGLRRAAVKPA